MHSKKSLEILKTNGFSAESTNSPIKSIWGIFEVDEKHPIKPHKDENRQRTARIHRFIFKTKKVATQKIYEEAILDI